MLGQRLTHSTTPLSFSHMEWHATQFKMCFLCELCTTFSSSLQATTIYFARDCLTAIVLVVCVCVCVWCMGVVGRHPD